MSAPILKVEGLTKRYGSVAAVSDITVSVSPGSTTGIIGSNGAGKTTFINMVTGWQKPSEGTIVFEDARIDGLKPRAILRRGLTRSFQIAQLFANSSVADHLLLALASAETRGVDLFRDPATDKRRRAVEDLMERFSIAEYADLSVSKLPQGLRKVVDVAMALASRPRLMLLDEPTSGVSADEKFATMDIVMGALRDQNVTILFVEHDMDIIERYADRVLAFIGGRIICDGRPADVFANDDVARVIVGEGRIDRRPAHV